VPVTSIELGSVAGRSPGDETAVWVVTVLLFFCISVFGSMVLTGVVEEKASRVVEVLLAVLGVMIAVLTSDVMMGVIAGAGFIAIAVQMINLWTRHSGPPVAHQ
jgi:ABC-2 type transport system permease protein